MKSPKDMKIIQIELTNACINKCSNCTRFCGWHQKPFYMDFETFKKAVDSLQGFQGMIGIMGGEPTLHPQFSKFVDYLNYKYPSQSLPLILPQESFNDYRQIYLSQLDNIKKGLWSCLGKKYYENFEQISDSFNYQCINDHRNNGQHQALLVARKDLGISDKQFQILRDNCWIQNLWSASITPKGCFFCEIAAALDILFDGPGGWKIEKEWWKRQPKDFGQQLKWCQYCSACLKVPSKKGNEEIDIISNSIYEKLKDKNAYKANNKCYEIFTKQQYNSYMGSINHSQQPYLKDTDKRIDSNNKTIIPNKINICLLNQQNNPTDFEVISEQDLYNKNFEDWCIIVLNKNFEIDKNFANKVYNPGVIYINQNYLFINKRASSLKNCKIDKNNVVKQFPKNKTCYIGKFHVENQDIKYSFLMPTYNSSKTVIKALDSIINQDYKNFDIFIVDDGSTDNTIQILKQYQKEHPQLKEIQINEVNSSAVISRNKLIDLADGDYSIWCDSDDYVNTNMCSMATYLLHEEKFDILSFPFKVNCLDESIDFWHRNQQNIKLYSSNHIFNYFMFVKPNKTNLWSKIIKTELLKISKPKNIRIDLVDDHLFVFPLYYNCKSYSHVNSQKMYFYNSGAGGWNKKNISYQTFKKNCEGIINAVMEVNQWLIKHNFNNLYIKQYSTFACLDYFFYQTNNVLAEDKFKAIKYVNERINQIQPIFNEIFA